MGFLFLVYGVVIGSFLYVVMYKIPVGLSIVSPHNRCGNCHTQLKPKDLVPVASYIFLKDKCGYCASRISLRYPLIEMTNGLLYVLIYFRFGLSAEAILLALFSSVMLTIAMNDFGTLDVYKGVVLGAAIKSNFRFWQEENNVPFGPFFYYRIFVSML